MSGRSKENLGYFIAGAVIAGALTSAGVKVVEKVQADSREYATAEELRGPRYVVRRSPRPDAVVVIEFNSWALGAFDRNGGLIRGINRVGKECGYFVLETKGRLGDKETVMLVGGATSREKCFPKE